MNINHNQINMNKKINEIRILKMFLCIKMINNSIN